jgi:hypothetical protein
LVDSFAGFRSDFIHYSISLSAPTAGDIRGSAIEAKNSIHFSPMLMEHFWRWWQLFDSSMSLPIRQGLLFPAVQAPSKKFGRHVATIKYRFDLSPMFLCHTYRQEDWSEWAKGITSVLGVKARLDSLKIDLHQRAEEVQIRRPEFKEPRTVIHKKFYLAEVHCEQVDLRAISATFQDSEKALVPTEEEEAPAEAHIDEDSAPDLSEEQLQWIDQDDFVDLGPRLKDPIPHVRVYDVLKCPVITYYRQPNNEETSLEPDPSKTSQEMAQEMSKEGDKKGKRGGPVKRSKFGSELTHTCLVGCAPGESCAF